jgi:hypothetical protein
VGLRNRVTCNFIFDYSGSTMGNSIPETITVERIRGK